jgi:hypothetical protein
MSLRPRDDFEISDEFTSFGVRDLAPGVADRPLGERCSAEPSETGPILNERRSVRFGLMTGDASRAVVLALVVGSAAVLSVVRPTHSPDVAARRLDVSGAQRSRVLPRRPSHTRAEKPARRVYPARRRIPMRGLRPRASVGVTPPRTAAGTDTQNPSAPAAPRATPRNARLPVEFDFEH